MSMSNVISGTETNPLSSKDPIEKYIDETKKRPLVDRIRTCIFHLEEYFFHSAVAYPLNETGVLRSS